jgi:hypothetical protein
MLSKSFLAEMSKRISIGRTGSSDSDNELSFGGISVILCGDLHQFPPIANGVGERLFTPNDMVRHLVPTQIGRQIYEEFLTVIVLKEQMRVTDPEWNTFLRALRNGMVEHDHMKMLRKLVITSSEGKVNFQTDPWRTATLVTPRHAVREKWNDASIRKWCKETGQTLFVCHADERAGKRPLTLPERYVKISDNCLI